MSHTAGSGVLAVIPARYGSTRFPGKMIVPLGGKPLVYHTCQRAFEAKLVSDVVVATDDRRVVDALADYALNVVMTRADHASGTDRVAEVAEKSSAEIIVNIQGDEPLINPKTIDDTIRSVLDQPDVCMGDGPETADKTLRHREPEQCEGGLRLSWQGAVFLPVPHSLHPRRSRQAVCIGCTLASLRPLRLPPRVLTEILLFAANPSGKVGEAGTAARSRKRLSHRCG